MNKFGVAAIAGLIGALCCLLVCLCIREINIKRRFGC